MFKGHLDDPASSGMPAQVTVQGAALIAAVSNPSSLSDPRLPPSHSQTNACDLKGCDSLSIICNICELVGTVDMQMHSQLYY